MSKVENGGLDQYGKVQRINGIGGERVNKSSSWWWDTRTWRDVSSYLFTYLPL